MTDRPTGSYTHERLIALEDSHKELKQLCALQKGFVAKLIADRQGNQNDCVLNASIKCLEASERVLEKAETLRMEIGI